MITIKTKSEVKVKVTVTRKLYATLSHPKMHPHTKFGIPTSKNIRVGSHMVFAWIHCTDVRIHCTDILIECR